MDEEFSLFDDIDKESEEELFDELSFFEKIQAKFQQAKEDFFHLPLWQKLALIIAGSIFFGILFYTIFTFTKLAHIQKSTTVGKNPPGVNFQTNQQNTQGQNNQNQNNQTATTPNQNTGGSAMPLPGNNQQLEATGSAGVVGFLQNLVGGKNSSSQTGTSSSTGGQSTQSTNTINSQNTQNGTQATPKPSQPYIVNFLNGLLYFQDPQTGAVTPYILSGINPADFTWGRYTNDIDKYAIDYPTNWQLVKHNEGGHEGISVYPPGEDTNNSSAQQIGLGWSVRYVLPTAGGSDIYFQTAITINNTLGQLYTLSNGTQGGKGIAVLLPHHFGYFGIGGSADTNTFIYVFQHMLSSLTLIK